MIYKILAFIILSASVLSAQNELTQLRINELKKQKEIVDKEIEQYNQQLVKIETQLNDAQSRRSALMANYGKQSEALNREQAALDGYDLDQLNATIKSMESNIASNNKTIKKLNARVEKNNRKIQKLMTENEQNKVQIALLTQQNETATSEINNIRGTIKDMNLAKKTRRLNKSQRAVAKLNQRRSKIDSEIEYYKKQKSETELKRETAIQRLETILQTLKLEEAKLN